MKKITFSRNSLYLSALGIIFFSLVGIYGYYYLNSISNDPVQEAFASEYSTARNAMRLSSLPDGRLEIRLRDALMVGNTQLPRHAEKIAIYYITDKPSTIPYESIIESENKQGKVFKVPKEYNKGIWHFNFFSGSDTRDENTSWYLFPELWLGSEYIRENIAIRKNDNGYSFAPIFR